MRSQAILPKTKLIGGGSTHGNQGTGTLPFKQKDTRNEGFDGALERGDVAAVLGGGPPGVLGLGRGFHAGQAGGYGRSKLARR